MNTEEQRAAKKNGKFRRLFFFILAIPLLAALYYVASIIGLVAPVWPTDPEIHPRASFSGNVSDIAFDAINASALFDIESAELVCGVDQAIFADASGRLIGSAGFAFVAGKTSIPARGKVTQQCDVFGSMHIGPGGSVTMRSILSTAPTGFTGPLQVRKICLWIGVNYKIFGTEKHFRSKIFQWPASQDDHSWIEARNVSEQTRKSMKIGDIACGDAVRLPYNLFNGPGAPIPVFQ